MSNNGDKGKQRYCENKRVQKPRTTVRDRVWCRRCGLSNCYVCRRGMRRDLRSVSATRRRERATAKQDVKYSMNILASALCNNIAIVDQIQDYAVQMHNVQTNVTKQLQRMFQSYQKKIYALRANVLKNLNNLQSAYKPQQQNQASDAGQTKSSTREDAQTADRVYSRRPGSAEARGDAYDRGSEQQGTASQEPGKHALGFA